MFSPKPGIRHGSPGGGRWRLAGSYISTSENEKEKWWKENYRTGMFAGLGRNKNTSDLGKSFKAGPGYRGLLTRTKKTGRKLLEEKGRKGRKALLSGFGKRAALCPGDVCCGTPRNKKAKVVLVRAHLLSVAFILRATGL